MDGNTFFCFVTITGPQNQWILTGAKLNIEGNTATLSYVMGRQDMITKIKRAVKK